MEEAPENGKESSHSAHANGIEYNYNTFWSSIVRYELYSTHILPTK
jgi:hypothetical protein